MSQTAAFSPTAAARGADPQCALSPGGQPLLLPHPCSGQALLLLPFCLQGFHSLPRRTPIQGDGYSPIPAGRNQHSNALCCFQQKEQFKCIQRQAPTRSKLNASRFPEQSLRCSWIAKGNWSQENLTTKTTKTENNVCSDICKCKVQALSSEIWRGRARDALTRTGHAPQVAFLRRCSHHPDCQSVSNCHLHRKCKQLERVWVL